MKIDEALVDDVIALVESIVLRLVREDERLLETGVVDSVLAVEIVIGVALLFGVRVPAMEIPVHLASVEALCLFIAGERAAGHAISPFENPVD